MAQDTTATLDPGIAERNRAALRQVDPELARRLAELPDACETSPVPTRTRDGRVNFRLVGPDGSAAWFGRTSIPGVRAAALLDRFDAGKANVFFPGIAEGTEVELLLQRIGWHRAIFVWETELRPLKLALQLHDMAAAISQKRLVLMVCPPGELRATLQGWMKDNPGHLCPSQMMMFPWQTMAEIAPIRLALEQAYHEVEQSRQRALAEIQGHWRKPPAGPPPSAEPTGTRLAILALHALDEVWATADVLSSAAVELGWPVTVVDIRGPGDMHSLARAARLLESPHAPPNFAILLDILPSQVTDLLPPALPAISWLSHRTESLDRAGQDVVAFTSPAAASRALAERSEQGTIAVCPPPCLAPIDPACLDRERPIDVVLITDCGPVDPASLAPKLPSYAQIWKAAADLLSARIETFTADQAEEILARIESKAGARIDEPSARADMLRKLSYQLAPSLMWRFIAERLRERGIAFRIHGPGWFSVFRENAGPRLTTIRQKAEVFTRSKVAVYADPSGLLTADALLAAGCGAAMLARRHPTDTLPGGLHSLLTPGTEILPFLYARELIASIQRLLGDAGTRGELATSAVRRCLADHMPVERLKTLRAGATSTF